MSAEHLVIDINQVCKVKIYVLVGEKCWNVDETHDQQTVRNRLEVLCLM